MILAILSVVVGPITEVGKYMLDSLSGFLKRQIGYLTNYNTNIKNLRSQVNQLKLKRDDVETSVNTAEMTLDVPSEQVVEWLENVRRIIDEENKFFKEKNANQRCLKGLCPDLRSRFKLSKQAVNMVGIVSSLQQQGNSIYAISHYRILPPVELVRANSIVKNLPSRDLVMKDVMEALRDNSINSIGLHGAGGIGKTTLVNDVNNQLEGSNLFKKVIKVIVSRDPKLNIIQDQIAARLGLDLKGESSTTIRANKLFKRLQAEESLLIILDDLWEKLKVVDIGLALGEHMGCKVLITTRYLEVCMQMRIQKPIEIKYLSEDESWTLFETKAGDVVTLNEFQSIARDIVRKCKGSPLAIATLGSTLATVKQKYVWENALMVLKSPDRSGVEDIMPEVVKSLQFSYEYLRTEKIKRCFLYCCLFPEDYNIDLYELRDYGIGEGFLNVTETLENALNELLSFVKQLIDCGLLLKGGEDSSVKMHDVVWAVAIWIASDDENGFLVNIGGGSRIFGGTEKMKKYKRISFMNNENKVLSDPLECPKLQTLLFRENKETSIDEENFFEDAKSLVVLDLRGTWEFFKPCENVISPPKSLLCLTNLRCLYLIHCDLSNKLSELGGLKKLEILKLCDSVVDRLPEDIGDLTNLMCLDLTEARLSTVAPNAICRLSNLEELSMWNHFNDWDTIDNASFGEVAKLTKLTNLKFRISDVAPSDMSHSWKNLKTLRVSVNGETLRVSDGTVFFNNVNPLEHWVNKLLSIPSEVHLGLYSCYGIKNVGDMVSVGGGLIHFEELDVIMCRDIEYIIGIDESNKDSQDSFGTLEELTLEGNDRLREIFHGPTPSTTFFGQLRSLTVSRCGQIKKIFSSNLLFVVKRLDNLEELDARYCYGLEEVFNTEEEAGEIIVEPETITATRTLTRTTPMVQHSRKSMALSLYILPKMTSIWKGIIPFGSLQNLKVFCLGWCKGLEYLSSYETALALFQNVETLWIYHCDRMKKLIEEEKGMKKLIPPPAFPNLRTVGISQCDNLKSLFSLGMARDLQQLISLDVFSCKNMEVIIGKEEEEEENEGVDERRFLPRLQSLKLDRLSNLRSIIQGNLPFNRPNLEKIIVIHCPKLEKIDVNDCPNLEEIVVNECPNLKDLEWE